MSCRGGNIHATNTIREGAALGFGADRPRIARDRAAQRAAGSIARRLRAVRLAELRADRARDAGANLGVGVSQRTQEQGALYDRAILDLPESAVLSVIH